MSTFNGWPVITLPTTPAAPRSVEWNMREAVAASQSPFSFQRQVHDWGAGILRASLSYAAMRTEEARPWKAFLMAARGSLAVFEFGDPLHAAPQNPGATAGAVSGSGQTGYQLVTTSSGLQPGDWFQVGSRLYGVTSVSGGTLGVWPNLRESPTNATPLVITNPKGMFRLAGNDRGFRVNIGPEFFFTFEIEEAV